MWPVLADHSSGAKAVLGGGLNLWSKAGREGWSPQQLAFTGTGSTTADFAVLLQTGSCAPEIFAMSVANPRQRMKKAANRVEDFCVDLFWYIDFCYIVKQGQAYEVVLLALV